MSNSVWTFPYSTRYYLTHPWKWFQEIGRNIRDTYRRARYGWTYVDAWNWDTWFLNTVPPMLRHIAEHGSAYPGSEPFMTYDSWTQWLRKMADLLDTGDEEWQNEHNEYYEEYICNIRENDPVLRDKYLARAKELAAQGNANICEALGEIAKHFHSIWD